MLDPLPDAGAAWALPCDAEEPAGAPCDGGGLAALFVVWAFVLLEPGEDGAAAEPLPDEDAGVLDAEAVDDEVEPPVPFELVEDAVLDGALELLPLDAGAALLLEAGWDG